MQTIEAYVHASKLFELVHDAKTTNNDAHILSATSESYRVLIEGPNANELAMKYTIGNPANKPQHAS